MMLYHHPSKRRRHGHEEYKSQSIETLFCGDRIGMTLDNVARNRNTRGAGSCRCKKYVRTVDEMSVV